MHLDDIDTPAVLIDLDIVDRNIRDFQKYCNTHGLRLRPHIKTHKLPALARKQVASGAIGITCQKISEAEIMADAGIDDILITFNIVGARKLDRLRALAERVRLSVVADNPQVIAGLGAAFSQAATALAVFVECDTGARRCGVTEPGAAVDLARQIQSARGLDFAGLMTYPAPGDAPRVQAWMTAAVQALTAAGLPCPVISSGGSPDMWQAHTVPIVTEYRIGTYIYNDRSLVDRGTCTWSDCALSVLATVVSTPEPGRAVIDAGSKTLSSDRLGLDGYGHVLDRDDIRIATLSEEHGVLACPADAPPLRVGQGVRIIPNHACVVSNLFDQVAFVRDTAVTEIATVAARGRVT